MTWVDISWSIDRYYFSISNEAFHDSFDLHSTRQITPLLYETTEWSKETHKFQNSLSAYSIDGHIVHDIHLEWIKCWTSSDTLNFALRRGSFRKRVETLLNVDGNFYRHILHLYQHSSLQFLDRLNIHFTNLYYSWYNVTDNLVLQNTSTITIFTSNFTIGIKHFNQINFVSTFFIAKKIEIGAD